MKVKKMSNCMMILDCSFVVIQGFYGVNKYGVKVSAWDTTQNCSAISLPTKGPTKAYRSNTANMFSTMY